MADIVFTAAHKVVIDCIGFIVAERSHHENRRLVFDLLAEALPHARATENSRLDQVILAAIAVSNANRAMTDVRPNAALDWMAAHLQASQAFAEFALWRLALSGEKFHQTQVIEGAA